MERRILHPVTAVQVCLVFHEQLQDIGIADRFKNQRCTKLVTDVGISSIFQ